MKLVRTVLLLFSGGIHRDHLTTPAPHWSTAGVRSSVDTSSVYLLFSVRETTVLATHIGVVRYRIFAAPVL